MAKNRKKELEKFQKEFRKKYYIDITAYLIVFLSSSALVLISPVYLRFSDKALSIASLLMSCMNFIIVSLILVYVRKLT